MQSLVKKIMSLFSWQRLSLMALSFLAGSGLTYYVINQEFWQNMPLISSERHESGYTFISPLLECEYFHNQADSQLRPINKSVEQIVEQHPTQHISVYYRDLVNGPWYGFNETEPFSPQSLLKIPVAITLLKLEENNPGLINTQVAYDQPIAANLPEEDNLVLGESYTVHHLIERTLILSDNIAFNLLVSITPEKFLQKVHQDLNLIYPSSSTPDDFISVRSYSTIFRILYNSSYLSRENSEYLLSVLARGEFQDGLVAGLPSDVVVAHKFGIKNDDTSSNHQLHDCGVVYESQRPYVLCVMTRGSNIEELKKTIQDISRAVYQVVQTEH